MEIDDIGVPGTAAARAAEVIVRHMWREVDPAQDPEGHLLEFATGLDISGRRPEAFPASLRAQVVARYPRLDLGTEFIACFRDQAARKLRPSAIAASDDPEPRERRFRHERRQSQPNSRPTRRPRRSATRRARRASRK